MRLIAPVTIAAGLIITTPFALAGKELPSPTMCSFVYEEIGGEAYWEILSAEQSKGAANLEKREVLRSFLPIVDAVTGTGWVACAESQPAKPGPRLSVTLYAAVTNKKLEPQTGCVPDANPAPAAPTKSAATPTPSPSPAAAVAATPAANLAVVDAEKFLSGKTTKPLRPGQWAGIEFSDLRGKKLRFMTSWLKQPLNESLGDYCRKFADDMLQSDKLDKGFEKLTLR